MKGLLEYIVNKSNTGYMRKADKFNNLSRINVFRLDVSFDPHLSIDQKTRRLALDLSIELDRDGVIQPHGELVDFKGEDALNFFGIVEPGTSTPTNSSKLSMTKKILCLTENLKVWNQVLLISLIIRYTLMQRKTSLLKTF